MMATRADFGFPAKKRLTTYGRAGRRYGSSNSPGWVTKEESSPSPDKLKKTIAEAPTEPSPRRSSPKIIPQQTRRNVGRGAVSDSMVEGVRASTDAPSIGKTKSTRVGADSSRAKKRKVDATTSLAAEDLSAIYSPPSSPPPVASPKRSARPNGLKASSVALPSIRARKSTGLQLKDVDEADTPFSSKTSKTFRELSIDNATPEKVQSIPFRLTQKKVPRTSGLTKKTSPSTAGDTRDLKPPAPTRRGKRLIDALAAQVEDSSEEEQVLSQETVVTTRTASSPMLLDSTPPPSQAEQPSARTFHRQAPVSRKPGPKFTYSQQRTMLAEESLMDIVAFADEEESQKIPPFLGLGNMAKTSNLSAFSFVDDEDDTTNTGAVQSLHELRQAGANSRFSDEMADILDRIGSPSTKPSSLRRGALLELAQKMKEKSFRLQFRNHSGDGDLFKGLSTERDLVAGYAIVCILTTLLATSLSQLLFVQLQSEGITHLLLLLLEETSDVSAIVKDRKRNVSRNAQATLSTIKDAILKLPIWEPTSPTLLSPRTLALKALDLLARQPTATAAETELFSSSVTDHLFTIVSDYANPDRWEFPAKPESIDFYLALHLLEHHSVSAMQSSTGARWTTELLPTLADVLGVALQRPVDKFDDLETTTLKLTLNMTNNNHETPAMFVNKGLLRDLAEAACRTFDVVNKSIMDDAFLSKVLDSLILMLGVKINFCEHHSPAARDLMNAGDGEISPLNRLIRVFLEYHSIHGDADSMEKTKLNVAFGYLSILLGHLCLHQPIRERFMSIHSKRNLDPLIESIRLFIILHRMAAAAEEGESFSKPEANAADRLQNLVDQLEVLA